MRFEDRHRLIYRGLLALVISLGAVGFWLYARHVAVTGW